ncbi:hypothetical protein CCM_02435 [Cordyceps militaris CM01]|uniref:Uncharacterized protein n=1 Tax=Cordyceps militaris (strain CM01) TaxID=983644 RepID=G3J9N8_CORMM|nr:uncharacterized protein CCM_02435 [Cordyceps militaris CM01]EGX94164.1 hypothetical protein CCM_02435 [Cordyceps militaris CM01]
MSRLLPSPPYQAAPGFSVSVCRCALGGQSLDLSRRSDQLRELSPAGRRAMSGRGVSEGCRGEDVDGY